MLNEAEEAFEYRAAVGWDLKRLSQIKIPKEAIIQRHLDEKGPLMVRNPAELNRRLLPREIAKRLDQFQTAVFISFPIVCEGEVIAYLNLDNRDDPDAFSQEDIELLKPLAEEIALAVRLERARAWQKERDAIFRLVWDRLADALFITDFEGRILECNAAAERQTGYSREELLELNIMRDLAVEEPAITYEKVNQQLARGETVRFEELKRRKDGTLYWTECAVVQFDYKGRPATISVNRDITERKEMEARLRGVYRLSRGLALSRSKEEACERAVQIGRHLLGAQVCAVLLVEERGEVLRLVAAHGLPEGVLGRRYELTGGSSPPAEVVRTGKRIHLSNLSSVDFEAEGIPQVVSRLSVPLRVKGKVLGVFDVASPRPHGFSADEVRLFEALAAQVAVALEAQDAMEAFRESERTQRRLRGRLEELHLAARRLATCATEEEVWKAAVQAAREILGFDECDLAVREGDELVSRATLAGLSPPGVPRIHKDQGGICWHTLREGKTLFGDPRDFPEAVAAEEYRSFISVPIGDRGVFQAASKEEDAFTEDDASMAELLAGHVAEALRRIELEEELRRQAIHDPLTGLYNRRHLAEVLEREVRRAERYGHPFTVMILDLDNFKQVNDRYGHLGGDEVLRKVAQVLKESVRETDLLFRYGGDEFVIVLPETDGAARRVAARLRKRLAKWAKEQGLDEVGLGLSIGVTRWTPERPLSMEELLRRADAALYRAKSRKKLTGQSSERIPG